MKIAFVVLSFFAMAVANAAPISVWETRDSCELACWEYIGPKTNHGDETILGLVNQLGLGEFTSIVRYNYEEGELPTKFDGGYSIVVFKGGQDLWAFQSFADFTGQCKADVSYTAYFGNGPDLDVEVPEPASLALLGLGLLGMGFTRKFL